MRRRLLGTLLWCVLLPIVGLGRCLAAGSRIAVARVERVFVLGGLAVVLSMPNPLSAQISQSWVTLEEQMTPLWVLAAFGVVLLGYGLWSPWLRRFRRVLRHRGWFL